MTWIDPFHNLPQYYINNPEWPNHPSYFTFKYQTLPQVELPFNEPKPSKIPHKCPVCVGRGHMPYDFYLDVGKGKNSLRAIVTTDPVRCRSCKGTGIVWETQEI